MSDEEKLIAKLAAKFMVACIKKGGIGADPAYANRCIAHAERIVNGAKGS